MSDILRKSYSMSFKALPDEAGKTGRFSALVAIYGTVDLEGDRVMPGAFDKTIMDWKASGDPIPLIWSHSWADPFAHIGSVDPNLVTQSEKGMTIVGEVDLSNPFAAQVYSLMQKRLVKEFSYAYRIVDERVAVDRAHELLQLDLAEIGPTLKGMHPDTELLSVKADLIAAARDTHPTNFPVKAGATISTATMSKLQAIHDTLASMGAACIVPDTSDDKSEQHSADDGAGSTELKADEDESLKVDETQDNWFTDMQLELLRLS